MSGGSGPISDAPDAIVPFGHRMGLAIELARGRHLLRVRREEPDGDASIGTHVWRDVRGPAPPAAPAASSAGGRRARGRLTGRDRTDHHGQRCRGHYDTDPSRHAHLLFPIVMRLLPPDSKHTHGSSTLDECRPRLRSYGEIRKRRNGANEGETEKTAGRRRTTRARVPTAGRHRVVRQDGRREHPKCGWGARVCRPAAPTPPRYARREPACLLRFVSVRSVPPFVNLLRFLRPLRQALRRFSQNRRDQ